MTNPFSPDNQTAYLAWREAKLAHAITDSAQLIVQVSDPANLSHAERDAMLMRYQRSNMVIYASDINLDETGVQKLASQFGLQRLDANWLAGAQGVTRLEVSRVAGQRQAYIPYTDKPIKWHTDGYYNPPDRQIRAMVLHCAQNAGSGGENCLMDHEIAYLLLRDINPDFIHALSQPDAMTIPERTDEHNIARPAQTGPVFSINRADGSLHMRYTARTRSIEWKQDDITLAAKAALEQLLSLNSPHIHTLLMQPGMGLLCNNVLHDRAAFIDESDAPRLLFRARYLDRLSPV
jgi:hypothetical protein